MNRKNKHECVFWELEMHWKVNITQSIYSRIIFPKQHVLKLHTGLWKVSRCYKDCVLFSSLNEAIYFMFCYNQMLITVVDCVLVQISFIWENWFLSNVPLIQIMIQEDEQRLNYHKDIKKNLINIDIVTTLSYL